MSKSGHFVPLNHARHKCANSRDLPGEHCSTECATKEKEITQIFTSIVPSISRRRFLGNMVNSPILDLRDRLRCEHAAESVNDVAVIAIDYVSIGGLHFQTIARRPGAAAQHSPITIGCAVASFVSVKAPFPNVSAQIVQP